MNSDLSGYVAPETADQLPHTTPSRPDIDSLLVLESVILNLADTLDRDLYRCSFFVITSLSACFLNASQSQVSRTPDRNIHPALDNLVPRSHIPHQHFISSASARRCRSSRGTGPQRTTRHDTRKFILPPPQHISRHSSLGRTGPKSSTFVLYVTQADHLPRST